MMQQDIQFQLVHFQTSNMREAPYLQSPPPIMFSREIMVVVGGGGRG